SPSPARPGRGAGRGRRTRNSPSGCPLASGRYNPPEASRRRLAAAFFFRSTDSDDARNRPMKPAEKPARRRSRATPPKVGFVSLGCPKAMVDSERILTQLRAEGYDIAGD